MHVNTSRVFRLNSKTSQANGNFGLDRFLLDLCTTEPLLHPIDLVRLPSASLPALEKEKTIGEKQDSVRPTAPRQLLHGIKLHGFQILNGLTCLVVHLNTV